MKIQAFFLPLFPTLISALLLILAALLFSGCYTLKQGSAMLGYLGKAVPLEELANGAESGETAENESQLFVQRVMDIRRFAMEELGLKESKNYTRYVEIDRDYLAAVVSACAADSFTRHEWHFPVVGTVPYKGFFDPKDARKEAAKLKAQGLDVWVRGVDAFSTLGWFKDPLYSYMKKYTDYQLADLIIHELLHATVFIRGRMQFNEQLAEFVGTQGARLYIENRFGTDSEAYRNIDGNTADAQAYRAFLRELSAALETIYADTNMSREEKLQSKEDIIAKAKERYEAEYDERFQSETYRFFSEVPVNNAYLDLYRLYYEEDSFFADLYEKSCESSTAGLRRFVEAAKTLKPRRSAGPDGGLRQQLEGALGQ
jgi:predicted aminopeptidase